MSQTNIQPLDPTRLPSVSQGDDGYMKDSRAALVPVELVKPIDKKRDCIVRAIAQQATQASSLLAQLKDLWNSAISEYVTGVAKSYDVKLGGKKGNITLISFDGEWKVQVAIADRIIFDERLQVAKQLIDQCIKGWTKDSRSEVRVLIDSAFEVDKQGKINTERILGLRRLRIESKMWKRAMQAISDSVQVASSKSYIRIYARQADGNYKQIALDFASL